jgi:hypothetical protein
VQNFSVGEFAEQIMAQDWDKGKRGASAPPTFAPDESHYSPEMGQQAPDISNIEVPMDFVNTIVENKTPTVEANPMSVMTTAAEPAEAPLLEVAEIKSLVTEVKDLLIEVKQTLSEMTSVGMGIGAPAAGVAPKKDKKDDSDEDDLKNLLKKIKTKRAR